MIFHRQRGESRTVIAVKARMRIGEFESEATLTNASSRGVMAVMASPPVRGTRVQLLVGGHVLTGQVRWNRADCCGIALRDPVSVADLLEGNTVPVTFIPERKATRGWLRSLIGEWGDPRAT